MFKPFDCWTERRRFNTLPIAVHNYFSAALLCLGWYYFVIYHSEVTSFCPWWQRFFSLLYYSVLWLSMRCWMIWTFAGFVILQYGKTYWSMTYSYLRKSKNKNKSSSFTGNNSTIENSLTQNYSTMSYFTRKITVLFNNYKPQQIGKNLLQIIMISISYNLEWKTNDFTDTFHVFFNWRSLLMCFLNNQSHALDFAYKFKQIKFNINLNKHI